MEIWAFTLVSLVVGLAVGAWLSGRRGGLVGLSPEVERRVLDHVERIRVAVAGEVRDGSQSLQKAIADAGVQQAERLVATLADARREQTEASQVLADRVSGALGDARKEQGEQLGRLGQTQGQAAGAMQQAVVEAMALARRELAESLGGQGKLIEGFRLSLTNSGGELRDRVTGALDTARAQQGEQLERVREAQAESAQRLEKAVAETMASARTELKQSLDSQTTGLNALRTEITNGVGRMGEAQAKELRDLSAAVAAQLDGLRKDNEQRLESIRATVEEKLQTTLENRLGESFRQVSERLEKVHEGLGEMKTLAAGVGDLKKVLTNVKTRGVFGETQLAALLEEAFTAEQFDRNVEVRPHSNQRVEFAIRLPGRNGDGSTVWLPIDAKFPLEDYQRLQAAYEAGNVGDAESARQSLKQRALGEAQSIQSKYIAVPHTTDFALLFVPTEGLYAEILRIPGLHDAMMHDHHVVLVGPTTLHALLASLQMGFRTLAIEKRTSDVWRVLGAVKTEFAAFGESLQAVNKKIQQAGSRIEDVARRSRAMQRKLRDVEGLPESDARVLLKAGPPVASTDGAEQTDLELVAG